LCRSAGTVLVGSRLLL